MSASYTKLFNSLVTSTVWQSDLETKVVWVTLLALADQHGEVQGSVPGLAHIAGVSVEGCERALEKFKSPDRYSRTKDHEGRRLEEIDGGWSLLNYQKYRNMASLEDQKQKTTERQRRHRARKAAGVTVTVPSRPVTRVTPEAEGEEEAEVKKKRKHMTSSVGEPPEGRVKAAGDLAAPALKDMPSNIVIEPKRERPKFRPAVVTDVEEQPPMTAAEVVALQQNATATPEALPFERPTPPNPNDVPEGADDVAGVNDFDIPAYLDQTECGAAVRLWNETCSRTGWPAVKKLSAARRAALSARLKDVRGVRGWGEALALAEKSPFLTGKTGRSDEHANWQCNFDFIIKESKFLKLIEGGFNGLKPSDKRIEGLGGVLAGLHRAAANRQSPPESS